MTQFSSSDYMTAGLATLSRQCICSAIAEMPYVAGEPISGAAIILLKLTAHQVELAINILDRVTSAAIVLAEQAAFPLFLQVFNRFYGSIEAQIQTEEIQLRILRKPQTIYIILSPLQWIILGEYCDAFQAHIDSHKAIIYAPWETVMTTVKKVIDGDTIRTDATTKTIRIKKLKCPELKEEGGDIARDYAVDRLLHQKIKLIAEHHCDIYSRILADVEIDGVDFGDEMIRLGLCGRWEE